NRPQRIRRLDGSHHTSRGKRSPAHNSFFPSSPYRKNHYGRRHRRNSLLVGYLSHQSRHDRTGSPGVTMNIAVVGTGYVGLVAGSCFAESGNDVVCVDNNSEKIESLRKGVIPIYEPGLPEIVERNLREERLTFSMDLDAAVKKSLVIFLA